MGTVKVRLGDAEYEQRVVTAALTVELADLEEACDAAFDGWLAAASEHDSVDISTGDRAAAVNRRAELRRVIREREADMHNARLAWIHASLVDAPPVEDLAGSVAITDVNAAYVALKQATDPTNAPQGAEPATNG